jgi:ATP-dependent DNA helicase RecG
MARVLQRTHQEAAEALKTAAECRVGTSSLLTGFKDVWILSPAALSVVESAAPAGARRSRGALPYRRPEDPLTVVRLWLSAHERITLGDYAALTGLSKGRNSHFLRGPRMDSEA